MFSRALMNVDHKKLLNRSNLKAHTSLTTSETTKIFIKIGNLERTVTFFGESCVRIFFERTFLQQTVTK